MSGFEMPPFNRDTFVPIYLFPILCLLGSVACAAYAVVLR
jgi:hypothetical protein